MPADEVLVFVTHIERNGLAARNGRLDWRRRQAKRLAGANFPRGVDERRSISGQGAAFDQRLDARTREVLNRP